MEQAAVAPSTVGRVTPIGIARLAIALLSLAAAALSPWVIDALEPERRPGTAKRDGRQNGTGSII